MQKHATKTAILLIDLAVMIVAFAAANALRFDFQTPPRGWAFAAESFWLIAFVQMLALLAFGCYRLVWRFITARDMPRFVGALAIAIAVLMLLRFCFPQWLGVLPPYSIALGSGGFTLGGVLLVRVAWRIYYDDMLRSGRIGGAATRRVLLVGAGDAGTTVAREIRQSPSCGLVAIGFLDDDPTKKGNEIQGIPVYGVVVDLERVAEQLAVEEVLVTMINAPPEIVRRVVHACKARGLPVKIAPRYHEILNGALTVGRLREVRISDLLGREEIDPGGEQERARFISGRRVLITGAGGSIGSEMARQTARMNPATLVLVERSENALYEIDRELREAGCKTKVVPALMDVGDRAGMQALLERHAIQVVLHAAAHKHVPMIECNALEALRNNVLLTRTLGELAIRANVEVFVQLSTDKAVNPSSVMGASKRLAEQVLQDLNAAHRTRFAAVRFGNVLGSAGSVVPLFREQIEHGGPVTVTHPDMRRYFMTIPEAARLVLQAASMTEGGEIFILDMGEPVRIVELAEEMIRLSGLRPHEDIRITYTGIRPGEKLFEALSTDEERAIRTRHPRIFIGRIPPRPSAEVAAALAHIQALCTSAANENDVRRSLTEMLPDFQPTAHAPKAKTLKS